MSYGETERFNHGDLGNLERRMERNGSGKGSMIVVDGVYSMVSPVSFSTTVSSASKLT